MDCMAEANNKERSSSHRSQLIGIDRSLWGQMTRLGWRNKERKRKDHGGSEANIWSFLCAKYTNVVVVVLCWNWNENNTRNESDVTDPITRILDRSSVSWPVGRKRNNLFLKQREIILALELGQMCQLEFRMNNKQLSWKMRISNTNFTFLLEMKKDEKRESTKADLFTEPTNWTASQPARAVLSNLSNLISDHHPLGMSSSSSSEREVDFGFVWRGFDWLINKSFQSFHCWNWPRNEKISISGHTCRSLSLS